VARLARSVKSCGHAKKQFYTSQDEPQLSQEAAIPPANQSAWKRLGIHF
jgi:hypothetical protein